MPGVNDERPENMTDEATDQAGDAEWELRLYVAGQTTKSITALANLKKLAEEHMHGKYHIEVIDLMQEPQRARTNEVIAIPTLVRKLPEPIRKIIGDLSDKERVLVGLELKERAGK